MQHRPPPVPSEFHIQVIGRLARQVVIRPADLEDLPRRRLTAPLHCVTGWSSPDLGWEGVEFRDIYRLLIEPALIPGSRMGYLAFVGLDGYRSIVTAEDALGGDMILADRLHGSPLTPGHGAPVRVFSPNQYGFVSTKQLARIEIYRNEPTRIYHTVPEAQRFMRTVSPHRRARVWQENDTAICPE